MTPHLKPWSTGTTHGTRTQIPDWLGGTAADCPINEGGDVPLGVVNKNAMESEGAPMIDLEIKHGKVVKGVQWLIKRWLKVVKGGYLRGVRMRCV